MLNKRSEAARLSVPALCFLSPAIHYEWKVSQQNCLFSQLASRPETRALVCLSLSTLSSPSTSAKGDCQMRAKNGNLPTMSVIFLSFYVTQHTRAADSLSSRQSICLPQCNRRDCGASTKTEPIPETGTCCVFGVSLKETDQLFTVGRRYC